MIRLLLTSGRGPAECRIALRKTLGILLKEAEVAGVTVDVTVGPDPDGHGPASAITIIEGEGEEAFVTTWIGSILWVVQSPLRPHHKRKNWFIGVFRLEGPPPHRVPLKLADVRFETLRAGGPGAADGLVLHAANLTNIRSLMTLFDREKSPSVRWRMEYLARRH